MTRRLAWALCALGFAMPHPAVAGTRRAADVARQPARVHTTAQLEARLTRHSDALASLARGVETAMRRDPASVAQRLYVLEVRAVDTLVKVADLPESARERVALLDQALSLVRRITYQKDHVVGPYALRMVRAAVPGEPMQQLISARGRDRYALLDRASTDARNAQVVPRSAEALYAARWAEFVASGGGASDIEPLSSDFLRSIPSGTKINWVQRDNQPELWVSLNGKHVVTAKGQAVRGGGELKPFKNRAGEVVVAFLSNSSGSIKAGAGALEGAAAQLRAAQIEDSRIVYTQFTPVDPQLLRLVLVSDPALNDAAIERRLVAAERLATQAD